VFTLSGARRLPRRWGVPRRAARHDGGGLDGSTPNTSGPV